ncbi:MAG: GIY-YIG nuclease family protein [Lachnospiraceae bacterium]|nr:GIY-YIG nuclease family protein [Ruminococcus sp.]MCM1274422.1 GIY-YIG nuclease family protein [Lachnospiraceae bacterium]
MFGEVRMLFWLLIAVAVVIVIGFIVGFVVVAVAAFARSDKLHEQLSDLSNNGIEVTPEEFFKLRNSSMGGRGRKHISANYEFSGVYILFNHTKNKYYVGQGVKVFQRVNSHFTGHGNGDVYADYKYGDQFTIKLIKLEGSGFGSLNELERRMIGHYNAFSNGYNKTRGNRG